MIGRRKFAGGSSGGTPAATLIIDPRAQAVGMELVSIDPMTRGGQLGISDGLFVACLVYAPRAATLTKLGLVVEVASADMIPDTAMGIYTSAGVLIQPTGDMSASFTTTGFKEGTLAASVAVTKGLYYIGLIGNTSAGVPKITGTYIPPTSIDFVAIGGNRASVFTAANLTLPASFNPATATINSGAYLFTAR
jgi:hypothetical protein